MHSEQNHRTRSMLRTVNSKKYFSLNVWKTNLNLWFTQSVCNWKTCWIWLIFMLIYNPQFFTMKCSLALALFSAPVKQSSTFLFKSETTKYILNTCILYDTSSLVYNIFFQFYTATVLPAKQLCFTFVFFKSPYYLLWHIVKQATAQFPSTNMYFI